MCLAYFTCSFPSSFHPVQELLIPSKPMEVQAAARSGAELKPGDVAVSSPGGSDRREGAQAMGGCFLSVRLVSSL